MKLNKKYWENRYLTNQTGWDIGSVSTPIKDYIDQLNNKNIKILIPGAGNAYELDYLIEKGFKNIYVVDFAETPLNAIKKRLPDFPTDHLIQKNFFDLDGEFDLIIEQTFFCALDPALREKYSQKMHGLLKEKGKLSGLLFDFPLTQEGPPFGGSKEEYLRIFSDRFTIKKLEKAYNSIKPRAERELFFIFEKK